MVLFKRFIIHGFRYQTRFKIRGFFIFVGKRCYVGHIFESFVFAEILKSYYNDGIVKPPLYYYRDMDKNEIDILIKDGETLYPVEIKTSSDPVKSMVNSFRCLNRIPGKKSGTGALICLAKERLPLLDMVWTLPVHLL